MTIEHHWEICLMCGPIVVCGACGMNCCSGGYGSTPGGKAGSCTHCPSAYEMMLSNRSNIKYYISKSKSKKAFESIFK